MTTKAPPPLTVHVTCKIDPSKMAEFYALTHPLHEKLSQEEKCLYMNVYEILGKPGVVRLVEVWDCDLEWMGTVCFSGLQTAGTTADVCNRCK